MGGKLRPGVDLQFVECTLQVVGGGFLRDYQHLGYASVRLALRG
jgi:hypothetical protein